MGFKRMSGIRIPYKRQILIYAVCLNFENQPRAVQEKIRGLCASVGKNHADALFELVTDDSHNVEGVALRHFMAASVLYGLRRKFYENW